MMSDSHALSGAYAVDALDQLERMRFERHLADCSECQSEVAGLREASSLLAETTMMTPPASLRDRVLADIDAIRPLPPVVQMVPQVTERSPRRIFAGLVAAAAAVVLIGGGVVVADQVRDNSSVTELGASQRIQQAPDTETYTAAAAGGGSITVYRSKTLNQAVVKTSGLAALPSGHTRELWLQHNNEMIPAGYLKNGANQEFVLDGDPASAQAFGVTVEQAQGARSPSANLVALLKFSEA